MADIERTRAEWEEAHPPPPEPAKTGSGLEVDRLYDPTDAPDYLEQIGFPGQPPFTRGAHASMYRTRLWTMRQYAGFGTAADTNARFRTLLEKGQTGLSVAFDLPTQIGYDADHPLAVGEVGKTGVHIGSLDDMEQLFEGIPLDEVSISMTINATAIILMAYLLALADKQGIPRDKLRGTVQNDILKEYVARGTYRFPPRPSMRLVTDIIAYCTENVPKWNTISISGYHIREAGATATQELAFTLAHAIAYVEAATARGLDIDAFARRLSFFLNGHNDILEEVAKFRAARRIWARIMKERFGAKKERSLLFRFHTQTAGSMLTAQQPENNVVRVALQALAAILGGTQSLHTNARDEALGLPTEASATLALRTQQILAHESGVTNTVDPLGGSYYVESLTDRIEEGVWSYLEKIDDLGGAPRAIEEGFIQGEIEESALQYQREVEDEDRIVVGVNRFAESTEEAAPELFRLDPKLGDGQREKLRALKERRDESAVTSALEQIRAGARSEANLLPRLVEAVKQDVTTGEICAALADVFGEHRQ